MKNSKIFKLTFLLITVAILIIIIFVFANCTWKKYGPFHHQAMVYKPSHVYTIKDKQYCYLNGDIYEVVDNVFIKKEINIGENETPSTNYIRNMQIFNEKIYIATTYYLYIFDAFWHEENKIALKLNSFIVDDNIIYYTDVKQDITLHMYNCENNQNFQLMKGRNCTYQINEKIIYVNDYGNVYFVDENTDHIFITPRKNFDYIIQKTSSFYLNGNTGLITLNSNLINISYSEKNYQFEVDCGNMFYDQIYTCDEEIIFATYEYMDDDICNEKLNCICHYGQTNIWSFNPSNNNLVLLKTLPKGTYLINFNKDMYCYYNDGKIYRNGNEIKIVNKIEPYGIYYTKGDERYIVGSEVSKTFIYDDGNNIFYSYYDYKSEVEN